MDSQSVRELLSDHRETLIQWGEESERLGERGALRRANRLFDLTHAQFKRLRESPEGRDGITALMSDPNPYVASSAAAHSLLWEPELATARLEELESSQDAPGQVQIAAEYTLKEWRAGKLSFEW
jgi:hypothetical protein